MLDLRILLESYFFPIILGVSLLVVIVMFAVFIRRQRLMQGMISALEKNMHLVTSASLGMGQRMLELESQLLALRDLHDEFKHKDLDLSYSQAHRLIEQGLSTEAVAANSGLSVSEVNLMELLHRETVKKQRLADVA